MKAYILQSKTVPLDVSLKAVLEKLELDIEEVELPDIHEEVQNLFEERDGGVVFIPAVWEDMLCVKVVQEVLSVKKAFEAVIVGEKPDTSQLILAFNSGLSAFLELPLGEVKVKQTLLRVEARMKKRIRQMQVSTRLAEYEVGGMPYTYSPEMQERDIWLARAFLDVIKNKGPLYNSGIRVLLVTTSEAQGKRLEQFLKTVGIIVDSVDNTEEALKKSKDGDYQLIITDNILPDGDAVELVRKLRKELTTLPRVIVWSASPDKVSSLLNPETYIDNVILKPGHEGAMESILPSIIAAAYSVDS